MYIQLQLIVECTGMENCIKLQLIDNDRQIEIENTYIELQLIAECTRYRGMGNLH